MPLQLIRDDITRVSCDAIVNPANPSLLGGGGVDGAIHRAAGEGLLEECIRLGGCEIGDAKITLGYDLPCKYVIHTVGPKWQDGTQGEDGLLRSCYRRSLDLAVRRGCESVAFPLISSGVYGFPKDRALRIAMEEITSFLRGSDLLVYIVVFDKSAFHISSALYDGVASFIDDKYADECLDAGRIDNDTCESVFLSPDEMGLFKRNCREIARRMDAPVMRAAGMDGARRAPSLDDMLRSMDESFSEMLLRKIDERGMTDAECYKKANVDRKLFSKIRSDPHYRPSKATALAFAIALELPLAETKDMLMKAGFALSRSSKFDVIIEYFITNKNYDIYEINEALFAFDQSLLGA